MTSGQLALPTAQPVPLKERQSYIGGSDASAILGANWFRSGLDVYLEKIGELEPEPSIWRMRRGELLEPHLREWYRDETGVDCQPWEGRHPTLEHLAVHIDGLARDSHGQLRLIEIKSTYATRAWDLGVPDYVLPQVLHGAGIVHAHTGELPEIDVIVDRGGEWPEIFHVETSLDSVGTQLEAMDAWWRSYVLERRAPPPSSPKQCIDLWPEQEEDDPSMDATPKQWAAYSALRRVQAAILDLNREKELIKTEIMLSMGTVARIVDERGKTVISWRRSEKPRLTLDALVENLNRIGLLWAPLLKRGLTPELEEIHNAMATLPERSKVGGSSRYFWVNPRLPYRR